MNDVFAGILRNLVYDRSNRKFLLSHIRSSNQSLDLSVPSNCGGYGRIHHFQRQVDPYWNNNPLPMDPACHALGIEETDIIEAQVFQLAACNVHCWYCFVPDLLKCADTALSNWFSAEEMITEYLKDAPDVRILDLSGGNPELAPEWILESMHSLERIGKTNEVYLWSDDTLTTDYLFEMDKTEIEYMASYAMYGKVCCFKGFDYESFSFNSGISPELFDKQFERFNRYYELGFDLYGYVTLTCSNTDNIDKKVDLFADRLQRIYYYLPLRVIPLKIVTFATMETRMNPEYKKAMDNQIVVLESWNRMLNARFSELERKKKIYERPTK